MTPHGVIRNQFGRRQAFIWTNAGMLLIRTIGTNFSEILSEIHSRHVNRGCIIHSTENPNMNASETRMIELIVSSALRVSVNTGSIDLSNVVLPIGSHNYLIRGSFITNKKTEYPIGIVIFYVLFNVKSIEVTVFDDTQLRCQVHDVNKYWYSEIFKPSYTNRLYRPGLVYLYNYVHGLRFIAVRRDLMLRNFIHFLLNSLLTRQSFGCLNANNATIKNLISTRNIMSNHNETKLNPAKMCWYFIGYDVCAAWTVVLVNSDPDSDVHGANMGPTWGRQDPGGSHVGHVNLSIWGGHSTRKTGVSQNSFNQWR